MNTLLLDLRDETIPVFRFFDKLIKIGDDADEKIDKGKAEIEKGDVDHGEADILSGTADKIKAEADKKSEDEKKS